MAEKKELSPKAKKIINIVVDVVVAIVLAFALLLAICTITSKSKGYDQYTEIFGKAYLAVASDSMEGEKEDNFSKGDLIAVKTLSEKEARKLKVGDIITFRSTEITGDGRAVLNTHRIIEIYNGTEGDANTYRTHGDHNPEGVNEIVLASDVIGVYKGKAGGIGNVMLWMNSSAGFFVCVVLPTLLVVVYCAVNLVLVILKEKKTQTATAEQEKLDERERIRQELLAEMQSNGNPASAEQPQEPENNPPSTDDSRSES